MNRESLNLPNPLVSCRGVAMVMTIFRCRELFIDSLVDDPDWEIISSAYKYGPMNLASIFGRVVKST